MNPELQPHPRKWPLSKKKTLLIVGGAILIVIIVIIMLSLGKGSSNHATQAARHERPGYDLQKLGDAYADPFAVTFARDASPISYKGNQVIQACSLLTTNDVTKQGLLIKANTLPTPISRVFNDGVGKADYTTKLYASSLSGGSLGKDVNNCHYVLEDESDTPSIDINVFQPFAIPETVIDEELRDHYTPSGTVEGLELFTKKPSSTLSDPNATEYIALQRGKGGFYLSLSLKDDQEPKKQSLLETAAKNFVSEQSAPAGASKLGYSSPIFPKSIVRACDLITNKHIHTLSGSDAGPLAREGIASSIGSITFTGLDDPTSYLYIDNECDRGTIGGGSGLGSDGAGDLSLTVETSSFLSNVPAKHMIEMQRQANPNNRGNMALSTRVGDESVGYTDITNGQHIIFSKGRIVVDIKLDQSAQRVTKTTSLASSIEILTPIAQSMENSIKE